ITTREQQRRAPYAWVFAPDDVEPRRNFDAPTTNPAAGGRRPRGGAAGRGGGRTPVPEDPADRVRELRVGGRPRSHRLGPHEQVLGGLRGPPLLRGSAG